jgi:TolB protein
MAQIRVSKAASYFSGNPTLHYDGVSDNSKLSTTVNNFIRACGWFNAGTARNADLRLSGNYSNGALGMTLRRRNNSMISFKVPVVKNDYRAAAKKAVDFVLEKTFKIKGLCSSKIVFCAETSTGVKNIYITDIDGKNVKRLTTYNNLCVEPEWFPNGKSIVYTKYNKSSTDIVQTMLNPVRSRRLASYPGTNAGASISPSGNYLALIMSKDRQVELYVKSVNSRGIRRLTKNNAVKASPCWSPDGKTICFVSDRLGKPQLFTIDIKGGKPRHIATLGNAAVTPSWSATNQLVYSAKYGSNYVLANIDLSGKQPGGVLVSAAGNWESPSWAPDNRHIVCSRTVNNQTSLWLVDSWTKKSRCLLKASRSLTMPAWSGKL